MSMFTTHKKKAPEIDTLIVEFLKKNKIKVVVPTPRKKMSVGFSNDSTFKGHGRRPYVG